MDLSPDCKPIISMCVFKTKIKVDGSIDKYKARLGIKDYKKTKGLDYFDTYSPMMRINSIRMVLVIGALKNLEVHKMDVKTAFLNEELDDEIYMEQSEGFTTPRQEMKIYKHERKIYKLVKSLYGLKQAPKHWHERFDNVMMSHGFKINAYEKCVYVIVCLYIDDMLIVGSDDKMITSTENMLNSRFDMKDLELADVIFGIKI